MSRTRTGLLALTVIGALVTAAPNVAVAGNEKPAVSVDSLKTTSDIEAAIEENEKKIEEIYNKVSKNSSEYRPSFAALREIQDLKDVGDEAKKNKDFKTVVATLQKILAVLEKDKAPDSNLAMVRDLIKHAEIQLALTEKLKQATNPQSPADKQQEQKQEQQPGQKPAEKSVAKQQPKSATQQQITEKTTQTTGSTQRAKTQPSRVPVTIAAGG